MRKFLIAVFCALPLVAAQTPNEKPPIDPKEMVHRAVDAFIHDDHSQRQYTYLQREDVRMLDGSGKTKSHDVKTWDVTLVSGSPYKRLVKRNDQPLSPSEQQQWQGNLQRSIDERRNETADQRKRRIADWEHQRQERLNYLNEIPDAFDFRLVGDDVIDGVPVWVIEGAPRQGFKPKSRSAAFFVKMKGRMWIAKNDYHAVKMDAVTLDTVSIGGFLIRFAPGGHVLVEFSRVNNEIWLPKHAAVQGSAKVLFVKGYHLDADYTFFDYKKFSTESRVVSMAAPADRGSGSR